MPQVVVAIRGGLVRVSVGSILIDASNLHIGGGVQVAASLVNEIASLIASGELDERSRGLSCMVSTEVGTNLHAQTWDSGLQILTSDSSPKRWTSFPGEAYDTILTVFGPSYRRRRAAREIVGFARGLMIYTEACAGLPGTSLSERILDEIRWRRFGSADILVTETADSAIRVAKRLPGVETHVIPNCVSGAVRERAEWRRPGILDTLDRSAVNFAAIGRDYPHKNLDFLGRLGPVLECCAGQRVRFLVTLSQDEWDRKPQEFRAYCMNAGVLEQRELGPVYEASTATVFPSLLEISSATPLETVYLGRPLFAANVPSLRAALGDIPRYFDPWDADAAAESICAELAPDRLDLLGHRGEAWSRMQGTPRSRALQYLSLLTA